jgi:hypothetical protein
VFTGQGVHWAFKPPGEARPGLQESDEMPHCQDSRVLPDSETLRFERTIDAKQEGYHSRARLAALRSGAKARIAHLLCAVGVGMRSAMQSSRPTPLPLQYTREIAIIFCPQNTHRTWQHQWHRWWWSWEGKHRTWRSRRWRQRYQQGRGYTGHSHRREKTGQPCKKTVGNNASMHYLLLEC